MDSLVIKLRKSREDITADVYISRNDVEAAIGSLYGLTLRDVEWLVLANTSECTTPFIVEVPSSEG